MKKNQLVLLRNLNLDSFSQFVDFLLFQLWTRLSLHFLIVFSHIFFLSSCSSKPLWYGPFLICDCLLGHSPDCHHHLFMPFITLYSLLPCFSVPLSLCFHVSFVIPWWLNLAATYYDPPLVFSSASFFPILNSQQNYSYKQHSRSCMLYTLQPGSSWCRDFWKY